MEAISVHTERPLTTAATAGTMPTQVRPSIGATR